MPPIVIRYDRGRFRRALVATFVVGTTAALLMAWAATLRRSLLARLLAWLDLPPGVTMFVLVEGVLLIGITYAALHARRRRDQIRLLPEGIEIRDSLGRYEVAWENVAESGMIARSMAGLRLKNRAQILETHAGTEEQRALLATREPFGGYDLLFARHDMDCEVEQFLSAVERYRRSPEAREELGD